MRWMINVSICLHMT